MSSLESSPASQTDSTVSSQTSAQDKSSVSPVGVGAPKKSTFAPLPPLPVIPAVGDIKFDFSFGCRVMFPRNGVPSHLTIYDADTENKIYDQDVNPGKDGAVITTFRKYFIRYRIEIESIDRSIVRFSHTYDAKDRDVLVQLPLGALGDTIAWFTPIEMFQKRHGCRLHVRMTKFMADIFRKQYPDIHFITDEEIGKTTFYAAYSIGLFFDQKSSENLQPCDFRLVGLHHQAANILGVPPVEEPPRVDLSAPRTIKEKYVCIAFQSSAQCKYWNNPTGWYEVVKYLKENDYRVLCMDKDVSYGTPSVINRIPWGTEDFTGDHPIQERINIIKDCDFFIGLSSGLSWLAWCCKVPVILISGFTHPLTEFQTPYRVFNPKGCNSCWNDPSVQFDHKNFMWCPRHEKDARAYECTKGITGKQVIDMIKMIQVRSLIS